MGARHTRELEDLSPVTSPPWSLFSLKGEEEMLGLEEGKGKIGEGNKKILVVCKESFKEKVFLWKNILVEKYIFLGKLSLWIVFLGKSILAEKKKSFLGGKTRLIAVSVFPEKTQPVLWENPLPDCVKTSIYVFSSFVIFFKYFIL